MAEAKKQKALAKKQQVDSKTSSLPQSGSEPASTTANQGGGAGVKPLMSIQVGRSGSSAASSSSNSESTDPALKSILKSAQNQSSAGVGSVAAKPPRGPNYCDVCCFEFSSAEVYLLFCEYC